MREQTQHAADQVESAGHGRSLPQSLLIAVYFWNYDTLRLGHLLTTTSVRGLVLLAGVVQEARILDDHIRRVIDRAANPGEEAGLL
jgi:hypothetical protein